MTGENQIFVLIWSKSNEGNIPLRLPLPLADEKNLHKFLDDLIEREGHISVPLSNTAADTKLLEQATILTGKHLVEYGYIKSPMLLDVELSKVSPFMVVEDYPEKRRIIAESVRTGLFEQFPGYLKESHQDKILATLDRIADIGRCGVILDVDKTPVACALTMPHYDCLFDPTILVAWIWISPLKKDAERALVRSLLHQWLAGQQNNSIKACIHTFNDRSRRLFSHWRFQLACIHLLKNQ